MNDAHGSHHQKLPLARYALVRRDRHRPNCCCGRVLFQVTHDQRLNWTDQGAKTANEKRHQATKTLAEKLGGRLLSAYVTTGRYDIVATLDMPDARADGQAIA